ncbi:cobalamin B12-binding domain-containing protein [Halanaerobaculum tunisiense]
MLKYTDESITGLPSVNSEAIEEYQENIELLIETVNDKLSQRNNIDELIGHNPLTKMYDNHENHAHFMVNAFKIDDYNFFSRNIIWVYNTYRNHGFSFDYFPVELKAWIEAINEYISSGNADSIIEVYNWMLKNHNKFIKASKEFQKGEIDDPKKFKEEYKKIVKYLLDGDYKSCLMSAKAKINSEKDLKMFFQEVIFPAMYKVGFLWQEANITVAEEHLASSISTRILSSLYSEFISLENDKGNAVITPISNEYHEIGSRIVADSLEMDGWNVEHLGSDTPSEDLIDYIKNKKPFLIGLSVAMPFNVDKVEDTIKQIRLTSEIEDIKILVGGKVFNEHPDLWKNTGADAWAKNEEEVVKIAQKWWEEENLCLKELTI